MLQPSLPPSPPPPSAATPPAAPPLSQPTTAAASLSQASTSPALTSQPAPHASSALSVPSSPATLPLEPLQQPQPQPPRPAKRKRPMSRAAEVVTASDEACTALSVLQPSFPPSLPVTSTATLPTAAPCHPQTFAAAEACTFPSSLPTLAPRPVPHSSVAPVPPSPTALSPKARRPAKRKRPMSRASDVVTASGEAYNSGGYRVCGVANKRGLLCGRIGTCPFHPRAASTPSSIVPSGEPSAGPSADAPAPPPGTGRAKGKKNNGKRFKRTWTTAEHSAFLVALGKHGRGKWKEIAADVGTRNGSQCQSHACKYFKRQAKGVDERKKASIHDINVPEGVVEAEIAPAPPSATPAPEKSSGHIASVGRAAALEDAVLREDAQLLLGSADGVEEASDTGVAVYVHLNNAPGKGVKVWIPENAEWNEFMPRAAAGLGVEGIVFSRMFTRSGAEIEALDAVLDGEHVWLSDGAEFSFVAESSAGAPSFSADAPGLELDAGVETEAGKSAVVAKDEAVEDGEGEMTDEERVPVIVRRNGVPSEGRTMLLPLSMKREEFLWTAEVEFGVGEVGLARIFTRSGAEIMLLEELMDGEEVWLSSGEDFSCG